MRPAKAAATPAWTIRVSGHPPGPNLRLHWAERYRRARAFREAVAWQARAYRGNDSCSVGPLERAHVVVTLQYRRRPLRDPDNAVASIKPCLDGLTLAGGGGLLVDDTPDRVALEVRQELTGWCGVVLQIEPLSQ